MRCSTRASLRASATLAFFMPWRAGDAHGPCLEARPARRAGEQDVGRFVQRCTHRRIADFADPAGTIDLAGLVFAWREAEVGADRFGVLETFGLVDRRLKVIATTAPTPGTVISRRHTWSSPTAAAEGGAGPHTRRGGRRAPQYRFHDTFEHWLAGGKLADERLERQLADRLRLYGLFSKPHPDRGELDEGEIAGRRACRSGSRSAGTPSARRPAARPRCAPGTAPSPSAAAFFSVLSCGMTG